jgi:hypothetical protein
MWLKDMKLKGFKRVSFVGLFAVCGVADRAAAYLRMCERMEQRISSREWKMMQNTKTNGKSGNACLFV